MEQRDRAVLPRPGRVSRQAVHRRRRRYRDEGLPGLADGSHRSHRRPWQIDPAVEAATCEVRHDHPRWGHRRLPFELGRQGCPGSIPSETSIYRVLVRNSFVRPTPRGRRREDYRRWERPESIHRRDHHAGKFTEFGVASTMMCTPHPVASMVQSLSMRAATSWHPVKRLRPSGDQTGLKNRSWSVGWRRTRGVPPSG